MVDYQEDYQRQAQVHIVSWATQAMHTLVHNTARVEKWRKAAEQ